MTPAPAPAAATRQRRPAVVVAVFDIEDQGAGLSESTLLRLSNHLATTLAVTGTFKTVPRSQLKTRLRQQKVASFKECYDQSCQIAIGRELAAQKSLATTVTKFGDQCVMSSVLYDLRRATSDGGSQERGGCSDTELAAVVERLVTKLAVSGR